MEACTCAGTCVWITWMYDMHVCLRGFMEMYASGVMKEDDTWFLAPLCYSVTVESVSSVFSLLSLSLCFLLPSTPSCLHFIHAFLFHLLCLVVSSTQSAFSMPLYEPDHSRGVSMFSCPLISWHTWQPHKMFSHRRGKNTQAFHSKWIKFYKSTSSYLKERISEIFYLHYNELNS